MKGLRTQFVFEQHDLGFRRIAPEIAVQQNLAPGHPCSTCDAAGGECGLLYFTDISLSDVWSPIIVDWPILLPPTQISTAFAPSQLMTIQFEMPPAGLFDLWIDDLAFDGP